jgi:hypothetical protein
MQRAFTAPAAMNACFSEKLIFLAVRQRVRQKKKPGEDAVSNRPIRR